MTILAIESSCDETSAAVIKDNNVISNIISSQLFHNKFGGVIPELASRAHLQSISDITLESLKEADTTIEQIEALAVTTEPGLIGSLVVGSNFAKGLSIAYNIPVIPINHIEGHLFSGCIARDDYEFPFITLVVSGGHTSLFYVESFSRYSVLGSTKDDAAGEAFDKTAKLLGLGYPGGPMIDKLSKNGNPKKYNFPRPLINSGDFNFSFSGLKTSVRYFIAKEFPEGVPENILPDLCASVQSAIVDVLVAKSINAALEKDCKYIFITGGVSANSLLRTEMTSGAEKEGIKVHAPAMDLCMDNAAMIGFIAEKKLMQNNTHDYRNLDFTVNSTALRAGRK